MAILNSIANVQDELLTSIYKREEVCTKLDDFLTANLPVLDKIIENLFSSSKKDLLGVIDIVKSLRQNIVGRIYDLDNKYSIECKINVIDYNLFLNKLNNIILISRSLIAKESIGADVYRYLTPKQKILSFKFLKKDWDSYDGKPISTDAIKLSLKFIDDLVKNGDKDIYFVAPSLSQGVIVELKKGDKKFRFDFEKDSTANYKIVEKNIVIGHGKISLKKKSSVQALIN